MKACGLYYKSGTSVLVAVLGIATMPAAGQLQPPFGHKDHDGIFVAGHHRPFMR
jgi:hypothetical protein